MKKLDYNKVETQIVSFIKEEAKKADVEGFVIGISGGVDSAVVSTLAAKSGLKLYVIQMPIRQKIDEASRATHHINWLMDNFSNVIPIDCGLTSTFESFLLAVEKHNDAERQNMAEANTRARLRMTALYYYASIKHCLVLGTGNKVEDFGIKFFSKYGDGGVDLSPIGDLMKSEVRALGRFMGVKKELTDAVATDGLWDDGRGDEDQIKATYDELEWAMDWIENNALGFAYSPEQLSLLTKREQVVLSIYKKKFFEGEHKMHMPPICKLNIL